MDSVLALIEDDGVGGRTGMKNDGGGVPQRSLNLEGKERKEFIFLCWPHS